MKEFIRFCPSCNTELKYKTKHSFNVAVNKNSKCKSCGTKQQYIDNPLKNKSKNNGRFGKSCYSIWKDKFGKDIADTKLQELKIKQSNNSSGTNNPMYGKISPKRSGGGWSGKYKEMFFRSLNELYFILNFEKNNPTKILKNAETKEFYVEYTFENKLRTYRPDFICDKIIYEIKSIRFPIDEITNIKFDAAKKYFNNIGYEYKIVKPKFSLYQFIRYTLIDLVNDNLVILSDNVYLKLENYAKQSRFKLNLK